MALTIKPIGSNMTELHFSGGVVLFSYQTPVACYLSGSMETYKTDKKWSSTTSRHINKWLSGVTAKEQPQWFFDNLIKEFDVVKEIDFGCQLHKKIFLNLEVIKMLKTFHSC